MTSVFRFAVAVSAILLSLASSAFAHAVLLEAAPPVHGSVTGPDVEIQLRFNCRIDSARSALKLVLPDGTLRPLAMAPQSSPDTLHAKAAEMKSGHYRLRWQVLAVDGHITQGEVPFAVR